MIKWLKIVRQGLNHLVFPQVCVCCGRNAIQRDQYLCTFCVEERFEDANPQNTLSSSGVMLPEGVYAQHALWRYRKGEDLQQVIHHLKYECLPALGAELGLHLGRRVHRHPLLQHLITERCLVLPVPLHDYKYRARGFNQAFEIARGFHKVWPAAEICPHNAVIRVKNTRSQTGFTRQHRLENLRGAFSVSIPAIFARRTVIIIDDVFTTGATSFELAQMLLKAGAMNTIILTVGQT